LRKRLGNGSLGVRYHRVYRVFGAKSEREWRCLK
jgi:hypothetical protein